MFAYCLNNPVNMQDSNGYWPTLNGIINAGKNLVENIKNAVMKVVAIATVVVVSVVNIIVSNPDLVMSIIAPRVGKGYVPKNSGKISKSSVNIPKSFSKSYPSQKAAKKAAFRDAGIGKHGKLTEIDSVYFNKGSREPFGAKKQVRQGWIGEKGHEIFHDKWGHKDEPFDIPHFNVYFKDGRKGHYYYPSNWDPKNNK